jgi:hypothetical protein
MPGLPERHPKRPAEVRGNAVTSKPIEVLGSGLLDRVAVSRRSALRTLLLGSSFAVPTIVTFSTARPAAAFTGGNFQYSNQTFVVQTLPPGTVELSDGAFFPQSNRV